MQNIMCALGTVLVVGCARSAPVPTSDVHGLGEVLQQRIEARKTAASAGDSVAWLRAAPLHPHATCVDASGAKRECRPDFGAPAQWRQRSVVDSLTLTQERDVAVVTYRQTDTVEVAGNLAIGRARYVETYSFAAGRWQLIALTEATIPATRQGVVVPASVLQRYVGTYGSATYALTVTLRGGQLHLAGPGETPAALQALGPTQFFARGDVGTYEFPGAGDARPDELRYHHQSHTYRFPRR